MVVSLCLATAAAATSTLVAELEQYTLQELEGRLNSQHYVPHSRLSADDDGQLSESESELN